MHLIFGPVQLFTYIHTHIRTYIYTHTTHKVTASNVIIGKPTELVVASDFGYLGNRQCNSMKPSQVVEIQSVSPSLGF